MRHVVLACALLLALPAASAPLSERIAPPDGFARRPPTSDFARFLRSLPLKEGRGTVLLHDGSRKWTQQLHAAVLDLDTGRADLQQCADTILRLRAEWLWAAGRKDELAFRFTSGHLSRWSDWASGKRPRVAGSRVTFVQSAPSDESRASFRAWLDSVFTYAGTLSLQRDLAAVSPDSRIEAGDVFVHGGSPGHAMIVVDVAEHPGTRERMFLLVQGFMPAQDAHVVVNPGAGGSPWYPERFGVLVTPEWSFARTERRRFGFE